ncbi:BglG family transcription antiterminator [Pontibacillus salicampi]|uniref:BglG family transcription antiterminator n=1 Tax=Pontibacillus salicampi TaxID=1449801 RepID=A0ABV6LRL1_9BACI
MLSTRQKELLSTLLHRSEYTTIGFLASLQNISQRSIRYDLDAVDSILQKMGASLTRTPGKGVLLRVSEGKRTLLFHIIEGNEQVVDKSIHIKMMSIFIVMKESLTIQELTDEFQISRSSVQNYLVDIEMKLEEYNLKLKRFSWKGIVVTGQEKNKRQFLYHMLSNSPSHVKRAEIWVADEMNNTLDLVRHWLKSFQKVRQIFYSESSLAILRVFICWWTSRIRQNRFIEHFSWEEERELYDLGGILNWLYFEVGNKDIFHQEKEYLVNLFNQAKVVHYEESFMQWAEYEKEKQFSHLLVEQISNVLQVDLFQDHKIVKDLTHHLKATFLILENGGRINNPYTEEIKVQYRAIYEIVQQLTMGMGHFFSDDEFAFITMHISACLDRVAPKKFSPTVVVVCSTGLATSSILTTKLAQLDVGVHLINVVSTEELQHELETKEIDFVLTTQEISFSPPNNTKIFRVSPLLNDNDKNKIRQETQKIINRNKLAQFNQSLTPLNDLKSILFRATIYTASTNDWRKAIEQASKPLLDSIIIRERYVQEMIMSVEQNGTYMVLLPKIAFVHAAPDNVVEEGLTMTVFDNEMDFGSFNTEKVKIIVVLAMKEPHNQDFLKLFQYLESEEIRQRLFAIGGKQE